MAHGAVIRTAERETYQTAWALPQYAEHSPGERYLPLFLQMTGARDGSVLDAGCGAGKGALALFHAGFNPTLCDHVDDARLAEAQAFPFVQACLWDDLGPLLPYRFGRKFDWTYCCDVLEHIPTPFTMLVVRRLLDVTRKGLFLTISLQPDQFGHYLGKSLHQTVQSFTQWRDQLQEVGLVVEARDLLGVGIYLVRP